MSETINLRKQAAHGFLWSAIEKFSFIGIRFVVQVALARLLAPEEFGLIAMILVFNLVGIGIMDSGFNQVVIQKKNISHLELCSIFYFNLLIGTILTGILWLCAPFVADFYEQPILTELMRYLSFAIVITAVSRIHMSQLNREMAFKRLCLVTWPSMIAAGIVGVVMALYDYGVWSLVVYMLVQVSLEALSLWFCSKWRPSLQFSFKCIRESFPYASQMAMVRLANLVAENMYFVVLGKYHSPAQTGYLQRAHAFRMLASGTIGMIFERVTFPLFSKLQDDVPALQKAYLRILSLYAVFFAFVMSLLAALAHPIITLLVGEKWLPSAPYLQLLCVVGFLYTLHRLTATVIKSIGNAKIVLRLTLLEHTIAAVFLVALAQQEITIILAGQILASIIAVIPKMLSVRKIIGISSALQAKPLVIPIGFAAIHFIAVYYVSQMGGNAWLSLVYGLLVSALIGLALVVLFRKYYQPECKLIMEVIPKLKFLKPYLIVHSKV